MINREKLLLYSLLGVLVLWRGVPMVYSMFVDPLEERRTRVEALEKEVRNLRIQERKLTNAKTRLNKAALRSLPPDVTHAAREYHNWLTEFGNKMKLTDYKVGTPRTGNQVGKTYNTVTAEITFEATLGRLCDVLYEFRNSGLLHRVAQLTVETSRHEGDPTLKVKITVEGVAMANSPERVKLIANPARPPALDQPLPERSKYASITSKNLFVKTYNGPRPSIAGQGILRPPTPPLPDATEFVYLTGRLDSNVDGARVFLYDQMANQQADLGVGGEFAMAGVKGKVVSIGEDYAVIEINGESWRLKVGRNFKQMEKLPKNETAPAEGAPSTAGG